MGNSNGNYQTTPELIMRAYDKLPLIVRNRIANAADDWVPQPILTRYRKHKDAFRSVDAIEAWDRIELARRERQRANGTGPYKGNVPDKDVGKRRRK